MEKVKFEFKDGTNNCTKKCEYREDDVDIYIGSQLCKECDHNTGYDLEEQWIKCYVYSSFLEVEKLTEEIEQLKSKFEQLENEIASLKGGCNGKK